MSPIRQAIADLTFTGLMKMAGFRVTVEEDRGWPSGRGALVITLHMRVPHRDTGELIDLKNESYVHSGLDTEEHARPYLISLIDDFMHHEAMEGVRFGDKQHRDPHKGDSP